MCSTIPIGIEPNPGQGLRFGCRGGWLNAGTIARLMLEVGSIGPADDDAVVLTPAAAGFGIAEDKVPAGHVAGAATVTPSGPPHVRSGPNGFRGSPHNDQSAEAHPEKIPDGAATATLCRDCCHADIQASNRLAVLRLRNSREFNVLHSLQRRRPSL